MSNLRTKIIRLAHENPELRKDLLPLIKQSGEFTKKEWETHKQNYPGADAKDHKITDGGKEKGGENKSESKQTSNYSKSVGGLKSWVEDEMSAESFQKELDERFDSLVKSDYDWMKDDKSDEARQSGIASFLDAELRDMIPEPEDDDDADELDREIEDAAHNLAGAMLTDYKKLMNSDGKTTKKKASLRTKLIRLAHENPDLRSDILPLLSGR